MCGEEKRAPFTDTYIFRGWEALTVQNKQKDKQILK